MKLDTRKNLLIFLAALTMLIIAGLLNRSIIKPAIIVSKQDSALNINGKFLSIFNSGYSRLISDIFWVTTLLESDINHYDEKDLNSWLYLRFKLISDLDPKFLMNYQFGGKYLSIIKDDLLGAQDIFERGLSLYPMDYELLLNAGFLYSLELNKPQRAYELYSRLISYPQAPAYIKTFLPKLKLETDGNLQLAYDYLIDLLDKEKDMTLVKRIKEDLYAIKATIDLDCLNSRKEGCFNTDRNGDRYILINGRYRAIKVFKAYKVNRRQKKAER